MTTDVRIETFRPELAEAFARLNREWIERLFEMEAADAHLLGDPAGQVIAPGGQIFFARLGDEIVGTAAAVVHAADSFELAKMAVAPASQGRGIGSRLGRAVIEYARLAGAREVMLLTNSRLEGAIRLYERLGFVRRPLPPETDYARADVYMSLALRA